MNKELERIARNLVNYKGGAEDISEERLQQDYERMKEVADSLTVYEMKMLWYLRHSGSAEMTIGILNNLEKHYEAMQLVKASRDELCRISLGVAE